MAIPAEHLKRLEAGLSAHESVSGGGPLGGSLYQVNMIVWLVPPDPHAGSVEAAYVDFTRPACDTFKRHEVRRVVGISALDR